MALVTCAELPELDPDDRLLLEPLASRDLHVEAAVWDDPSVDWSGFDLAVLRSPWDYARRRDEFVAWAARVPRLANSADIVMWNTDKRYLRELNAAGVPVVHTVWVSPDDAWSVPEAGEWVIKPAVSAGSVDTGRYDLSLPEHRELAAAHVGRLQAAGRLTMVQPYLGEVDSAGETALLYLDGAYSHAIRKGPMLSGPDAGVAGLYKEEHIQPREPSEAEYSVASAVLAYVVERFGVPLYARVDLIPDEYGQPRLIELELTEPSLFLGYAPGSADRLATAIAARFA